MEWDNVILDNPAMWWDRAAIRRSVRKQDVYCPRGLMLDSISDRPSLKPLGTGHFMASSAARAMGK